MARKPVVLVTGASGEMGHGLITRLAEMSSYDILAVDLTSADGARSAGTAAGCPAQQKAFSGWLPTACPRSSIGPTSVSISQWSRLAAGLSAAR